MITRRSLYILPTICLVLAILIVGFVISRQTKIKVNSADASTPPTAIPLITSLPVEPRGPLPESVVTTPAPVEQPTDNAASVQTKKVAPKAAPKPVSKPATPSPSPAKVSCSGGFTTQFICLLNDYRASKGLNRLSYNSGMAEVAANYSALMNKTGIFSHIDQNGDRFTDRCEASGIKCYGENLAKGFKSPQNLLDMWKASPAHNANMLRQGYTSVGLGLSGNFATMLFQ